MPKSRDDALLHVGAQIVPIPEREKPWEFFFSSSDNGIVVRSSNHDEEAISKHVQIGSFWLGLEVNPTR